VSAIVFSVDFSKCNERTGLKFDWQWQLGAFSITASWLSLLLNIRKLPFLGIYIVMFTDVLQTFLKLSLVIGLFVIAFALGFHCLLAEQVETLLNSL
jgi:hypothetical protein